MDHHNDGFGFPPYEEDPRASDQTRGTSREYRDDPTAYGSNSAQQYDPNATAYDQGYASGQAGFDERGYPIQPAQSGYADSDNPFAPHPIDANYGYDYSQQSSGGYDAQQDYYAQQPDNGNNGYAQQSYYTQPQQPDAGDYAQQGYYNQPTNDGYANQRGSEQYYEDPDNAYATRRQSTDYSYRGSTGRTNMPQSDEYGYASRGTTARTHMPDGVDEYSARSNTSRTRYPQEDGRYLEPVDDEDDYYERPRKKKRTKFGKFMHALGLYLAQLPAKTLVIIGGTFAMALVAVILLAVLLPNSSRTERQDDGQLALTDITPTPSIAPTNTPAPTEAVSPTPTLPVLTENISAAGTISDLIPDIQKRLVELGYMEEPTDGYTNKYGPITKTAIRLFQMKNFDDSANWDGIIGNTTYSLLMSDQAKSYYLTRGDGDDRTKVITKLVEDVTKLQTRLIELGYLTAGSATGLYGSTTVQAVQKFQEYNGLTPIDGKAGQETLNLIYTDAAMDATTGAANNLSKVTPTPDASATTSPDATTTVAP